MNSDSSIMHLHGGMELQEKEVKIGQEFFTQTFLWYLGMVTEKLYNLSQYRVDLPWEKEREAER